VSFHFIKGVRSEFIQEIERGIIKTQHSNYEELNQRYQNGYISFFSPDITFDETQCNLKSTSIFKKAFHGQWTAVAISYKF
jgi:hypothetical protein